jgi:hypothetical protein
MKSRILMFLMKLYYSIVGFFLIKKAIKKNYLLVSYKKDSLKTIKPLGNKMYRVNYQFLERTYGVQYFNEKTEKIKYWVIGVLYKNKEIILNKNE